MSVAVTWPGSNGTAFSATFWSTSTYNSGGAAGSDTFTVQSAKGRIACVASAGGNSKQQARYTHSSGNHSTTFDYRGTITWSAVAGGEATNFLVRSDNVVVANTNYCANCYVFEFDTLAQTVVCYKVTGSTPAVITSAPAATPFTFVAGTTYNVHFSLSNYTLAVTIWTGTEPPTPTYTVTDPDSSINSSTVGKWAWTNYHLPTTATNIDIGDATFTSDKWVEATAGVAASTGAALFDSSGGSTSLTLTATDAVSGYGTIPAAGVSARLGSVGCPTSAGAAYAPSSSTTNVTATNLTKVGTANTPQIAVKASAGNATSTGTAYPRTAGIVFPVTATATGVAYDATVNVTTSNSSSVTASAASAGGAAAGYSYVLDELGGTILDSDSAAIADETSNTRSIAPTSNVSTAAGAGNTAQASIKATADAAVSVGSAPAPGISSVSGGAGTTNVNPATAAATAAANTPTVTIATPTAASASTGTASAPQVTVTTQPTVSAGVGAGNDAQPSVKSSAVIAAAAAASLSPDAILIDGHNFASTAPIPIFATAGNGQVLLHVNAAPAVSVGVVDPPNQTSGPGQTLTIRDKGHTVTMRERRHASTVREHH